MYSVNLFQGGEPILCLVEPNGVFVVWHEKGPKVLKTWTVKFNSHLGDS